MGRANLHPVGNLVAIALPTAVLCFVLALSTLAARPDRGLAGLVASGGAGGAMVRRVMPALAIGPIIGWLRLAGQQHGLYGTAVGVTLMVTSSVAVLFAFVWSSAWWLHGIDAERDGLVQELDRRVELRTRALMATVDELHVMAEENQRLGAEAEHLRTERLCRDLTQKIRAHLEVDDVVKAAVAALGAQFDVDRVYIRLAGDNDSARVAAEWTRPGVQPVSELFPSDLPHSSTPMLAEIVRNRQSLVVNDVANEVVAPGVKEAMVVCGAGAVIGCLVAGPEALGVLALQVVGHPRVWTASDIAIVEAAAARSAWASDTPARTRWRRLRSPSCRSSTPRRTVSCRRSRTSCGHHSRASWAMSRCSPMARPVS